MGDTREIVLTRPTWRALGTRWGVAFVTLLVAYQLYALLAVPQIEPVSHAKLPRSMARSYGQTGDHPELAALFPDGSWERQLPKVLETQDAKLLFQDYQPSPDGHLRLHPCTVIFHAPSGKSGHRPIILQSPDGAVLNFAGPLNLARAEFSRLEGARLQGKITIFSPPTTPDADDALRIQTSNVQINTRQVWTPNDVSFQYGTHHGSGRDLTITMAPPEAEEMSDPSNTRMGHLKLLELVHLDKLVLSVAGTGMFATRAADRSVQGAAPAARPHSVPSAAPVEVTCQGPFQFDFESQTASFEQQVDIIRPLRPGQIDHIQGDRLTIQFGGMQPVETGAKPVPTKTLGEAALRLDPRRIEMVGQPVILDAPSFLVAAQGTKLSYDFTTRHLHLEAPRQAMFSYRYHYVESPTLDYELNAEPRRLGRLWAAGPGLYRGQLGTRDKRHVVASWKGDLELQPENGMHVLSAVNGARITLDRNERFTADRLYLWLEEVPTETPSTHDAETGPALVPPVTTTAMPVSAHKQSGPKANKYQVRPVKMLAEGHVHAESTQFRGDTPRLETWFDHDRPDTVPPTEAPAGAIVPPGDAASPQPSPGSGVPTSDPSNKRLDLSGDRIRLRIAMGRPQSQVREATITGHVHVAQTATVPPFAPLLVVTGDMLQLGIDTWKRVTVDVTGAPAHVAAKGMLLDGSNLHLSQRENRVWADGPGRMELPARRGDARRALTATPIWVSWQQGLDFDGQLIRFVGQVDVRGIQTSEKGERRHLRAVGDQLHVHLNRYVTLDHPGSQDDIDATQLRFLGVVNAENQSFDAAGQLISRAQMLIRDLVWDRPTGDFHATGPGWIVSTRSDRPPIGPPAARPTTSRGTRASQPLVYLRVDFQSEAAGNLGRRELEFRHYVRAVYGPVSTWDEILDPDRRGGLGPRGFVLTCDRLNLTDMGDGHRSSVEMKALGGSVVEGEKYLAKGDRLSYTQAKGLLVLEGIGHDFAKLEYREVAGKPPSTITARKIMYWPMTGQHALQGIKGGEFIQYGSPRAPSARLR